MATIFETERLLVREAERSDAEFVFELLNDPAFIANIGDRKVFTVEHAVRYIEERFLYSYKEHGYGMWIMTLRESSQAIGLCGVVLRPGLECEDLGYALLPEFWGRGFASEAAEATLRHAQCVLGIARLLAIVASDNGASVRVLEKIGFHRAGVTSLPESEEELLLFETTPTEQALGGVLTG